MDLCWFVCLNFSIIFKGLCEPELLSKEATDTFSMRDSLVSLVPSNVPSPNTPRLRTGECGQHRGKCELGTVVVVVTGGCGSAVHMETKQAGNVVKSTNTQCGLSQHRHPRVVTKAGQQDTCIKHLGHHTSTNGQVLKSI